MENLPNAWAAYAQFQSRLSNLHKLSDHTWGIEGALNVIFEPDFSSELTSAPEFRRAAASASRKRRSHLSRFLVDLGELQDSADLKDTFAQMIARQALDAIVDGIDDIPDQRLLEGIACGHDYGYLARLLGQNESSLRSRALRLRRRFAYLKP
jgi:hypothetical protein